MLRIKPIHHLLPLVLSNLDKELRLILGLLLLCHRLESLVHLYQSFLEQPLAEDTVEFVKVHRFESGGSVQLSLHNLHRLLSKCQYYQNIN